MKEIISFLLFAVLIFTRQSLAADFLIQSNGIIFSKQNEDPNALTGVKEWQVWHFIKGEQDQTRKKTWGMISEKTYEKAIRELEYSQKFEKRYEQWCQCSWGSMTYFNSLGPIAIFEDESDWREKKFSKNVIDLLERIDEEKGKYDEVKENIENAIELMKNGPEKSIPLNSVGNVFKEYIDNFKDVLKMQKKLRDVMKNAWLPADYITASLDEFSKDLDAYKSKAENIKSRMGLKPKNTLAGKWNWGNLKLEVISEESKVSIRGSHMTVDRAESNKIIGKIQIYPTYEKNSHGCRAKNREGSKSNFALTLSKDGNKMQGWYEDIQYEETDRDDSPDDGRVRLLLGNCRAVNHGRKEMTVTRAE